MPTDGETMAATGEEPGGVTWRVGSSMAMELDLALTWAGGYGPKAFLTPQMAQMLDALPADWLAEWEPLLGPSGEMISVLERAAALAGTLYESDYRAATLAARELSVEQALAHAIAQAERDGVTPQVDLPPSVQLVDLVARWYENTLVRLGLPQSDRQALMVRRDMERVVKVLRGGALHARFWHWLDRFYYSLYAPWRSGQAQEMAANAQRAAMVLGGDDGSGPPDLSWLPAQSPVLRYPELREAVLAGRLNVYFWVEPFGMADAWTLDLMSGQSGRWTLLAAFAEPGELYENFQTFAAGVAERTKALADPTRLVILRLIRHFGMINTEIADYLGLARPTVSIHAKILRDAGLIRSRPEGRLIRHEIQSGEVRRLFHDLERMLDLPPEEGEEPTGPDSVPPNPLTGHEQT